MPYHLCFLLCGICIAVAGCMSAWWYATTGDSTYVKLTAKAGGGILGAVILVILLAKMVLSVL